MVTLQFSCPVLVHFLTLPLISVVIKGMSNPFFRHYRWQFLIVLVSLGQVLAFALNASAVVLYSTATRNTEAPSTANGLAGWNLQATFGYFLVTPIDPTHFIAAKHISFFPSFSTVTLGKDTYNVDTSYRKTDPDSDLCIYRISSGRFSSYAPLYNAAVDGSEIGKTLTVFGKGRQRGNDVTVNGQLKGWQWGTFDHVQSWGQNIVSGLANYSSTSAESLLSFDFDKNGITNEAGLSEGDSSGAVFINCNGTWKLAGINYSVDGPWKYSSSDTSSFKADIFDAKGLYLQNSSGVWVKYPFSDPGTAYASRISDRLTWINTTIPEPGSIFLLVTGSIAAWLIRRRRSTVSRQ